MTDPVRALGAAWAGAFGLVFGSFANVCIARLPRHESIVSPRSRCPRCGRPIGVFENIPVLSWISLRGRCRGCRERIPLRYPVVEIAIAGLWTASILRFGWTLAGLGAAALCWFLVTLCATDAETLVLPDALTLPALGLGLLFRISEAALRESWADCLRTGFRALAAAAIAATLLLLVRALYWAVRRRSGLGLGDVKLFAAIAAWMGVQEAGLVFLLAVTFGAIYGLARVFLAVPKDPAEPVKVPLGSFLCLAGLYAVFFGRATLDWYLGFFSIA